MSTKTVKSYYISGLHALRSASEQGTAAAALLESKAVEPCLKDLMATYGETAANHEAEIANFLVELDVKPSDFKDRIMEGVGKGTDEMLKAAEDEGAMNLAVISGSQAGIAYFHNAFASYPSMANALDLPDQASRWEKMTKEWQEIATRRSELSLAILKKAHSS